MIHFYLTEEFEQVNTIITMIIGSTISNVKNPTMYIYCRLGAHGFIYLGKDTRAPGNAGLLDQVKDC
jgi:hypothetical protein